MKVKDFQRGIDSCRPEIFNEPAFIAENTRMLTTLVLFNCCRRLRI